MPRMSLAAAALATSFAVPAAAADISQSGFSPLYTGVDFETATVPSNPDAAGNPTTSRAYIARVDLKAPGIAFITTPQSGALNTISETTSTFATNQGVRVAINANFFAPCCDVFAEPKTVIGLLVSQGKVVAPLTTNPLDSTAVLAISRNNEAVIALSQQINLANTFTAIAGSAIIVQNGQDVSASSPNEGDPADPNPRTLVGLSADGRFLYLVVIDGRFAGYSTGTTNGQSAALMLAIGCASAINLDGGGSTEMVRADVIGQPYVVNVPSDGHERFDAVGFGVFARPLDDGDGNAQ